jgi:2-oxoglutarate-Fe(II)-dependent oxygenase superfamily protein
LTKDWKDEWGGDIELWDENVNVYHHSFAPIFNRCVVFATSDIGYHGVTVVNRAPDRTRKSFTEYYDTEEALNGWTGEKHSTVVKTRPHEIIKGHVFMPLETAKRKMVKALLRKRSFSASSLIIVHHLVRDARAMEQSPGDTPRLDGSFSASA